MLEYVGCALVEEGRQGLLKHDADVHSRRGTICSHLHARQAYVRERLQSAQHLRKRAVGVGACLLEGHRWSQAATGRWTQERDPRPYDSGGSSFIRTKRFI